MEEFILQDDLKIQAHDVLEDNTVESIEPLLDPRIVRAIRDMGFTQLTPIQEQAIPALLEGVDIIGQAQTGTGKTAAFGIPLLQGVDPDVRKLQALVLCPTRELAMQAAEELRKLAKYMHGIKVLPIYGGQEISKQISALRGVQIIVGTPGRVMDHMRRHTIKLDEIKTVVLDEADEMLNMGFREDMETILGQIPGEHQTALFSATMPQPILEITDRFQKDAQFIKVAAKELTIPLVSQKYYRVKHQDKDAATLRLLEYYQPNLCLIFCNTKKKVDELLEVLKLNNYQAEGLHGDMSQHQRDVAMKRFRAGSTSILIATDVAARGIDVDDVEIVINYDVPQDIEYYVHRIGRTGRAGKTGKSFTFVSGREIFKIREIERFCRTTVEEKSLPSASKVMQAKADKIMEKAWELHEHEDMELMKEFLARKLEEEGCDALELAAAMLKLQVGDKGEEIESDTYGMRRPGDRRGGRGGRDDRGGRRFDGRDGDRRGGRNGRDDRRFEGRDGEGRRGRNYRDDRRFEGRDGENRRSRNDRDDRRFDGRDGENRRSRNDRDDRRFEGRDGENRRGRNDRDDRRFEGRDGEGRRSRDRREDREPREVREWDMTEGRSPHDARDGEVRRYAHDEGSEREGRFDERDRSRFERDERDSSRREGRDDNRHSEERGPKHGRRDDREGKHGRRDERGPKHGRHGGREDRGGRAGSNELPYRVRRKGDRNR